MANPSASPSWHMPRSIFPSLINKKIIIALIFVSFIPFIYMWLYMGGIWNPMKYMNNVEVAFINADAGFDFTNVPAPLAEAIKSATNGQSMGATVEAQIVGQKQIKFDWKILDGSEYTYEALRDAIDYGTYQFGIYIPKNFSANYLSAFSTNSTAEYRPMVIQYAYDQGRDYSTASMITAPISRLVVAVSQGMARKLLTGPNAVNSRNAMVPAFWIEPIALATDVLHPINRFGQGTASYMSIMVMYIASIAIVTVTRRFVVGDPVVFGYVNQTGDLPLNQVETRDVGTSPQDNHVYNVDTPADSDIDLSDDESGTNTPKEANTDEKPQPIFSIFRIVLAKYVIMLGALFSQFEGAPSVAALFYLLFIGFCFINLLSLFCNLFGLDGFSLPASLFMIFMMSTGSAMLSDVLSPRFFRIGRGLPFHYGVQGLRFIFFGSLKSQMGLCCGVIIAWTVATLIPGVWAAVRAERIRRGEHIKRVTKRHRLQMRRLRRKQTAEIVEQANKAV
ncbi:hypothetical protein BDF19DRAFT_439542 [Syncephalis fuscata]|nr:hypothetical protein BDF19DRAFT_439542 [Syncephalis fuscata]